MVEPHTLAFRAMGSPCRVVVDRGRTDIARAVRQLVCSLERRWSRFLDNSEVSALNRAAGRLTVVSDATYDLVAAAARASELTDGRFNPLMLDQLQASGYRHSWDEADPRPDGSPVGPGVTAPIQLSPEMSAVRLPGGCRFDPGGIGKGLAVDRAIELCQELGSSFASVELGGDLRVYGDPWYAERWEVGVANPFRPDEDIAAFTPTDGAVTTSTTTRRRWFDGSRWRHHLLEPSTGEPSDTDLVMVATCSSETWWAEVVAKAALLAGSGGALDVFDRLATPGVAITRCGEVLAAGSGPAASDR